MGGRGEEPQWFYLPRLLVVDGVMWKKRTLGTLMIMNQAVSKAVCPANIRYGVALGKTAQRRRRLVLFSARILFLLNRFCSRYVPALSWHTAFVRFIKVVFLLFLLCDGVFLCIALYKQLLLLNKWFIFALLSILLAITLTCLLFDEIIARCKATAHKNRRMMSSSMAEDELMRLQRSSDLWSQYGYPSLSSYFPETPLPTFPLPSRSSLGWLEQEQAEPQKPLIRVLETIDMSSTNIEHFLETDPPASSLPPSLDQAYLSTREVLEEGPIDGDCA